MGNPPSTCGGIAGGKERELLLVRAVWPPPDLGKGGAVGRMGLRRPCSDGIEGWGGGGARGAIGSSSESGVGAGCHGSFVYAGSVGDLNLTCITSLRLLRAEIRLNVLSINIPGHLLLASPNKKTSHKKVTNSKISIYP